MKKLIRVNDYWKGKENEGNRKKRMEREKRLKWYL